MSYPTNCKIAVVLCKIPFAGTGGGIYALRRLQIKCCASSA